MTFNWELINLDFKISQMKSDEIKNLFSQFEAAVSELEGVECWSAREFQNLLGYSKWRTLRK